MATLSQQSKVFSGGARLSYCDAECRQNFHNEQSGKSGEPYHAMTYEEIAEVLGVSKQAVKKIEMRALTKLRERMGVTL